MYLLFTLNPNRDLYLWGTGLFVLYQTQMPVSANS
jgi:hypothetical protein